MPTFKPNVSRIILAWQRQKTNVILSSEDGTLTTSATPPATGPLVSTFSTTALSSPIRVDLDLSSVASFATSSSTSTTSLPPLSEFPAATTAKPVDLTSASTPDNSTTVSTASPPPKVTPKVTPGKATLTKSTTTKPPKKVATSSTTTTSPVSTDQRDPEEWINQVHQTPRPYMAERDCGIRSMPPTAQARREARVVGGRDSQLGEFPWSVLIRETTLLGFFVKTKCGGALIDLKWVLTAAHCKPGMFGSLEVVLGETDLGPASGRNKPAKLKPVVRKVKRMIIHRDYNPSNFDNDIALLELESPYQVAPHVVPICLPEKEESFMGQQAMVAGWGKLSFGGPVPQVLQVARLPVIGNKQCQEMYHNSGHIKIISDSFLCAGYASGGQDSCEGDSGGPLQIQRPTDGRWVLAGTVSHGIKCAEPNLPGIYVRIAAYLPWIKAVTYQQDHNKRYGYRRQFSRTGAVQLLA